MATLTYSKLEERNVSFQIIRTNPKLTSNVKLTVDSGGALWLNSINANSQLADQKYKKFSINENSNHEVNLFRFYDNGRTPSYVAYELGSTISKTATAKDLKDQYDFDLYTSGAKYLNSRQYSEKFTYLAPLYLDEVLPKKFVIFKIPGASNYTAGNGKSIIPTISQADFATDLFKNAVVVKVFDLGDTSKIGTYLHNIVNNPMFVKNPLYVNFKANEFSTYRGPSIKTGTYVELPEQLSTVFARALPILKTEQFVTQGFERNMIVHPRIINLEFLFNDDTSNLYEFNRYFGVYCNDIDLETFDMDLVSMYNANYETPVDNDQVWPVQYKQSDDISFNLTNSNGIKLRGMNLSQDLSILYNNRTDKDTLFFPYLKTRGNSMYLIKPNTWNQSGSIANFRIDNTSFDIGSVFGPDELNAQEVAEYSKVNSRSTLSVEFIDRPNHLDVLRIYHPSGSILDDFGKFDNIVFTRSYMAMNVPYSMSYSSGISTIYVNGDIDLAQLSSAICEICEKFTDTSITSVCMENTAFIQVKSFGDYYGALKAKVISISSNSSILINNELSDLLYIADGGFLNKSHAIISSGNSIKFKSQLSDILIRTNLNWSFISRICNYTDQIVNGLSESDQLLAISNYHNKSVIELVDDEEVVVNYNKIEIRNRFKPVIGILSLFQIKDFDFSTYTSTYSRNLLLDLYKDYFIPPNSDVLDFMKYTYQIIGSGTIVVNGITYSPSDLAISGERNLVWQNTTTISRYTVSNGTAILVYGKKLPYTTVDPNDSSYPDRLDIPYYDETGELLNYVGPFSIKADHNIADTQSPTYFYKDKYLSGNLSSEYHAYLENYNKEFAVDGRVIPYINKWGIEDSTDSRDNPYRLNSDILFGKDNFGPSHRETSPTAEKMTHEWFYIESDFNFATDINLIKQNFSYFDTPIDVNELIASSSYFENYFTYVPKLNGYQIDRPQYRYSIINKNKVTNSYETVFRGAKFKFYELRPDGTAVKNTNRFDDYKFSAILKPIKEDPAVVRQPVKYRIIENTDSKTITVLIELVIGDKTILPIELFNTAWNSPSLTDIIDQTTLFSGNFIEEPVNYSIDETITATSESNYYDLINGISTIPINLGKTANIVYGHLSSIIATVGSPVYDAVLVGKISAGDKLGTRVYAEISNTMVSILDGYYTAIKIQSTFEDVWKIDVGSPNSGEMSASTITFDASTTYMLFNFVSSSQYTNFPFADTGSIDQSYKLNNIISSGSIFSIIYGNSATYEESIFQISTVNAGAPDSVDFDTTYIAGSISSTLTTGDHIIFRSHWFIPSPTDSNVLAQDSFAVSHKVTYFDAMYGDYRVSFNSELVSNLTYSFLYSIKNKKYNNKDTAYSTIKLSRGLDLSASGVIVNPTTFLPERINTVLLPSLENYDVLADSEINQISNYFAPVYIVKPGEINILVESIQPNLSVTDLQDPAITIDPITGAKESSVLLTTPFSGTLRIVKPITSSIGDSVSYSYSAYGAPSGTTLSWINNVNQFQIFGGENYFEKIFENISFAKFSKLLDSNQTVISWESYTSGILTNTKCISIEIIDADEIEKSTIVKITPELVQSGQINQTAGFTTSESYSQPYSLNRYSGEYDIITKPVSAFKYDFTIGNTDLSGANVCLNPVADNFFILTDFEYVKYAKSNILDLEYSQRNSSVYPLIGETPIDRTNFNLLSSSWDYNYHFNYTTKLQFNKIAGTNRVTEDYSFISKLLNLPLALLIEDFTFATLSNIQFNTSIVDSVDLVYSRFSNEVRFKLNIPSLITKYLSNTGLRDEFQKFLKYSNNSIIVSDPEFLGELTAEEYLYQYCITNLVPLYQIDAFEFYELADSSISNNAIEFEQVDYNLLGELGYRLVRTVRINNTKSNIVEGAILIKPDTGIKLVPKIKIKFI